MEEDIVDIMYLDFGKAFDAISHYRLRIKMKKIRNFFFFFE